MTRSAAAPDAWPDFSSSAAAREAELLCGMERPPGKTGEPSADAADGDASKTLARTTAPIDKEPNARRNAEFIRESPDKAQNQTASHSVAIGVTRSYRGHTGTWSESVTTLVTGSIGTNSDPFVFWERSALHENRCHALSGTGPKAAARGWRVWRAGHYSRSKAALSASVRARSCEGSRKPICRPSSVARIVWTLSHDMTDS